MRYSHRLTWEHEAKPTRKYSVKSEATKISRLFPIIRNSSLRAVIIASEPPNYKKRFDYALKKRIDYTYNIIELLYCTVRCSR